MSQPIKQPEVTKFVIIVSGRNCAPWAVRNLYSIFVQDYDNYRVLYTDDASTDGTPTIVKTICAKHPKGNKVTVIENTVRKKLGANQATMLDTCEDNEVAVFLDGDDFFPNKRTDILTILNDIYMQKDPEIWATYGSYEYDEISRNPRGSKRGACSQMLSHQHHRRPGFWCGALRTYYVWLYKKIFKQDLKIGDNFVYPCVDLTFMFPIVEMAGPTHAKYIEDMLYCYNRANTNAVSITDTLRQQQVCALIVNRRVYAPLKNKEDAATYLDPAPEHNHGLRDFLMLNPLEEAKEEITEMFKDYKADQFKIKCGYNSTPPDKQLFGTTSERGEYQPDVYTIAPTLAELLHCTRIIDIGCGPAWKLQPLKGKFDILGLDTPEVVSWCKERWPDEHWQDVDLATVTPEILPTPILQGSVLICADVIEHLQNPTNLVTCLHNWLQYAPVCILSTPERDLEYGVDHIGPPPNRLHVREWNIRELENYLTASNMHVGFIGLTRTHAHKTSYRTTIAILTKNLKYTLK